MIPLKRIVHIAILTACFFPFSTFALVIASNPGFNATADIRGFDALYGVCVQVNPDSTVFIPDTSAIGTLYTRAWAQTSAPLAYKLNANITTYYSDDCTGLPGTTYVSDTALDPAIPDSDQLVAFRFFSSASTTHAALYQSLRVQVLSGYTGNDHIYWRMASTSEPNPGQPFLYVTDRTGTSITDFNIANEEATFDMASCNPLSFSGIDCLKQLFGWSPSNMALISGSLNTRILDLFPIGYITRFTELALGTATGTAPVLTLGLPANIGGMDTGDLHTPYLFNIQSAIDMAASELNFTSDDGYQFWPTIMPFVSATAYLALFFAILFNILGIVTGAEESLERGRVRDTLVPVRDVAVTTGRVNGGPSVTRISRVRKL